MLSVPVCSTYVTDVSTFVTDVTDLDNGGGVRPGLSTYVTDVVGACQLNSTDVTEKSNSILVNDQREHPSSSSPLILVNDQREHPSSSPPVYVSQSVSQSVSRPLSQLV